MKTSSILLFLLFALGTVHTAFAYTSKTAEDNGLRYENELKSLNAFLEDFDDGFYGYMEVVDDFVIIRFREGYYSKFRMQDMAAPVLYENWGQVNWDCKNESYCVETDWNDEGKETGILFSESGSIHLGYLVELLNNFIRAYNGK